MIRTEACFRFALLASTALSAVPAMAGDRLPTGGSVAHGSVDISTPSANAMAIHQSSDNAIVNWRGFSIGEGARVDIHQPGAASAILNRVTGSTTSSIAGQLNANGQVYLVNPNGIAITPTGTVKTGAFVASTLATTDEDFIAGRRSFQGTGRSAAVINQGSIEVGRGGYAALIGGKVDNSGTITASMGKIGLGAGERATLDISGDGFLQVGVPSDDDGDDTPLIRHSGRLSADGGRVEVKAATARQMARQVVNLSGVVEARSVGGRSGAIILGGGEGGRVRVSGRLDASAPRAEPAQAIASITPPPPRPSITITGAAIELAGATLDASAPAGGGSVRIGGDWQGGGGLPHALTTTVDAASTIAADALAAGDGGTVVIWSDQHTLFDGHISARGGPLGGDGGSAEVSGKAKLGFTGTADLSAARGAFGTLLLDPGNIVITDDTTTGEWVNDDDDDGGVTIALAPIDVDNARFVPSQADSILDVDDLNAQLGFSNVVVTTSFAFTGEGNITVLAPLSWTTGSTLSLQAFGSILIANSITATNGGLTLETGFANEAGVLPITTTPLGSVNVGTFILEGGNWVQNASPLPAFAAGDFRIQGASSFLRVIGGDGTAAAPWLIADAYGLQGIGSGGPDPGLPNLANSYALANDIDAKVTAGWNDVEGPEGGFDPIGGGETDFLGSLDGAGFAIDGLFINRPSAEVPVGLFQSLEAGASVENLRLTGVNVTGSDDTGGLAGTNSGSIERVLVSGTVSGTAASEGASDIGGLVGTNFGTGTITESTSSATVSGATDDEDAHVGGLAGHNFGTIERSAATGAVTATTDGQIQVGGLVGVNQNLFDASGALVSVASITDSRSTASVTATVSAEAADNGEADAFVGGLVGVNAGTTTRSYAAGAVSTNDDNPAGGLVGAAGFTGIPGTVVSSFWDIGTTGQDDSPAGTGLETADFLDTEGFMALATAGTPAEVWDFDTVWAPPSATVHPGLYVVDPVIRVDIDDKTRQYGLGNPPLTATTIGGPGIYAFGPAVDLLDIPSLLTTDADPTSDVGTYTITTSADSVTSPSGITYDLVPLDGSLAVTLAPLIITADDQSKTYGQVFTFDGSEFIIDPDTPLFNDDTVDSVAIDSTGAPESGTAGTHPIIITDAFGEGLLNYDIDFVDGVFTVGLAPLIIIADDQSKTYGQVFTFDGSEFTIDPDTPLFNDDTVDSVAIDSPGAPESGTAGTHAITITDAFGEGLLNYDIDLEDGVFTVDPAPLTLIADDQRKTYGQVFTFDGSEFTIDPDTPLFNDDTVDSVAIDSPGAPESGAAGTHAITITDAFGEGLLNYDIDLEDGAFTVDPAPLTLIADDQRKTYGQVFTFDGSEFTIDPDTPLFNDDAVTSAAISSTGAPESGDAGTHPIIISSATGTGLENYQPPEFVDGVFTVDRAPPLVIIANNQTKTYGQVFTFKGTEFRIDPSTPLVPGDAVTSVAIDSTGAPETGRAGTHPIIISSATGTGLENYLPAEVVDGVFAVDRAPLTIIANNQRKTYGNTFVFKGTEFSIDPDTPLFNDDAVTSATLSSPAAAGTARVGGPGAIAITAPLGSGLGNYLPPTLVSGDFTVDRRPLQIPIANRTKTYGETLASGFDYATGINGDTLRVLTASQGAGPAAPVAGNDYMINGTGVTGPDAGNYDVTFHSGLLTVTPRPLTVTADDLAKAFGRSFSFSGTEFTVGRGGLVNGDQVTAADLSSLGAAAGALPGSYTIDIDNAQGSGLVVDGVANYDITYADGDFLVVQPPNLAPTFNAGLRLAYYNELPNPVDTLDFTIEGGGGGPTLGPTRAVATTAARERAQDTLTFLESLSDGLEERVSACQQVPPDPDAFLACVGNALSEYADRIDGRILDLPEPLRQVSAVIRQSAGRIEGVRADAARRIASATTDAERAAIRRDAAEQASAAMRAAVNEINNAIDLIRAEDDPQLASLQSEQGATITAALQNVEDELIQAVGL